MSEHEANKKCPEYCPFLKANNTFCELFKCTLQQRFSLPQKCEDCLNPAQRMASYKSLGLSLDNRIEMWQNAVVKHNEIELSKRREEEETRQKFAASLSEKYGDRPPLTGNVYLKNLVINLFMVLDATERMMMQAVLGGRNGAAFLEAVDRAPKDESLLRNIRRELDTYYQDYTQTIQKSVSGRDNGRI
ncbi:MAG: hypothetical protein Q4D80_00865 [Pseudomonadota bacterium]|nr:hypothetical protein [Pseudomonadota bacterium]